MKPSEVCKEYGLSLAELRKKSKAEIGKSTLIRWSKTRPWLFRAICHYVAANGNLKQKSTVFQIDLHLDEGINQIKRDGPITEIVLSNGYKIIVSCIGAMSEIRIINHLDLPDRRLFFGPEMIYTNQIKDVIKKVLSFED